MNKKITLSATAIVLITLLFTQCKKTTEEDKALFSETQNLSDYTYYKNDNSILPSSPESAHNAFFRARFNATHKLHSQTMASYLPVVHFLTALLL